MDHIDNLIQKWDNELRVWLKRSEQSDLHEITLTKILVKIDTIRDFLRDLEVLKEIEQGQNHTAKGKI